MARIVVEEGKRTWVQELGPDEPRITIGRALSNKIIIEDSAASREHCSVERQQDGFHVTDLGSRNGTKLNGRSVKTAQLREGDRIEIGAAVITFLGDGVAAKPAPPKVDPAKERPSDGAASGRAPPEILAQDPETGLASFAYFLYELRRRFPGEIDGGSSTMPTLCVVKIDLDSLGLLNDVFGFRAGDEVIKTVGNEARTVVEESFGAAALVARESGGKFVVLLPGALGDKGLELAELVRSRVQERQLEGPLREASITVSCGVAACPEDSGSWRGVLRRAEAALSEAKRLGRDRSLRPPPRAPSGSDTDGDVSRDRTAAITRASGLWDSRVVLGRQNQEKLEPLLLTKEGQSALSLVAQVLGTDLEPDGLLEFALGVVAEATGAKRGWFVLKDEGGDMRLATSVDRDRPGQPAPEGEMSQGIVRTVLESRDALTIDDVGRDERYRKRASVVASPTKSVAAAPVLWGDEVVGVIYLDHKGTAGVFDRAAIDLLRAFGRLVAGPIRRSVIHRKTEAELERTRLALSSSAEAEVKRAARYAGIVGQSANMRELLKVLDRVSDMTAPVLILGESGTGKELVARAVHAGSRRARGAFVAENCAALPDQLLEAELFGHKRGAFTGADRDRVGLFEAAHGGTLFLDEVGDMSERLQAKLLRVLQEGEVRPLGSEQKRKVDVRVIAATHRDLVAMTKEGRFREDLYYRLAVLRVDVPPLRARREDVPLLVDHLMKKAGRELGRRPPNVSPEALEVLVHFDWPGNVRQLENEVRKLIALGADPVQPSHLGREILGGVPADRAHSALRKGAVEDAAAAVQLAVEGGRKMQDVIDAAEREVIARTLEEVKGNRSECARRLGLSRPGLLKKMKRYGIE